MEHRLYGWSTIYSSSGVFNNEYTPYIDMNVKWLILCSMGYCLPLSTNVPSGHLLRSDIISLARRGQYQHNKNMFEVITQTPPPLHPTPNYEVTNTDKKLVHINLGNPGLHICQQQQQIVEKVNLWIPRVYLPINGCRWPYHVHADIKLKGELN